MLLETNKIIESNMIFCNHIVQNPQFIQSQKEVEMGGTILTIVANQTFQISIYINLVITSISISNVVVNKEPCRIETFMGTRTKLKMRLSESKIVESKLEKRLCALVASPTPCSLCTRESTLSWHIP